MPDLILLLQQYGVLVVFAIVLVEQIVSRPSPRLPRTAKDRHIVVYCSCPNDVTAAHVALQLHGHGYRRAKPLLGGLDAWNVAHPMAKAHAAGSAPASNG